MSLAEHARQELQRAGWLGGEDPQSGEAMLAAVEAFARGGWSGGSAPYGVAIVTDLLQYKPLSPLTDDPAEWIDHGDNLWQSRRRPDAFSEDGGKTYRLQADAPVRYDRWPWLLWKIGLRDRPAGFVRGSDYRSTRLYRSERAVAA